MADTKPYIAIETIWFGNAAAHQPGDVVPDDNVKAHGWQDSVARQGTKAADAVQGVDEEPQSVSAQAPAPK